MEVQTKLLKHLK